jgi:rhodanese-related sulfurtransferase
MSHECRRAGLALMAALITASALAGDPVASAPLVSQDTLLARQAKHDPELVVLDVRTPEEFATGHVPGAINVPHDQLAANLGKVPRDKDVVVYCRSGRRSDIATGILIENGYRRVSHLDGDMNAWIENARPLEKP